MTTSLLAIATIGLTLTSVAALGVVGGNQDPAGDSDQEPTASAEDVQSIDAILGAVYQCISGPAGQARQWDRFRSLMHPDAARLMAVRAADEGAETLVTLTPDEYIELSGPMLVERGFWERELNRDVERFGHVAHVWSTYALRFAEDGEDALRGVNSFQLFFDDERWWVTSILWDTERDDQPIPERFLPQ